MAELPSGTVTFLFTDIEGSTRLLQEVGEAYAGLLDEHRRVLREIFARRGGVEVDTQGDAFFVAFARASDALDAAADAQAALAGPVRVRIGVHTGEPLVTAEGYVGLDVHRAARIAGVAHGGQTLVSRSARDLAAHHDLRDLGEHRLKDLLAPERLYQLGPGEFPPPRSLNATNLPVATSRLVGRGREVAELTAALSGEARLVTLVGTGGSGKTRLALQVAAELVQAFPGGVFFVPLGAVADPALVGPTVAAAVGLPDVSELRDRVALLLLDNFEHLLGAAATVSDLLHVSSGPKVLATSRAPLRVEGELEYPLEPLAEADALALLAERARAIRPGFEPDESTAEICRRLDGLPLALELAASRLRSLGSGALLERLDRRLPLLTGGRRDAPERHRTLRETIRWSYDLLEPGLQRAFRRLGVFATFSLDAAEQVADAGVAELDALVEASLLKPGGGDRFLMLETIREFALERLAESGEEDATRGRQLEFLLGLARRASLNIESEGPMRHALVAPDHDNVRAALAWAAERGEGERGLALAGALENFWVTRDPLEQRRWIDALLPLVAAPSHVHALALRCLGNAAAMAGEEDVALGLYRRSVDEFRELGEDRWAANARFRLTLRLLAATPPEGRAALIEESLTEMRRTGERRGECQCLTTLGELALEAGEPETALARYERGVELARSTGFPWFEIVAQTGRFEALLALDRREEAGAVVRDTVRVAAEIGDRRSLLASLARVARLEAELGHAARAALLAGALEAEAGRAPVPRWDGIRRLLDGALDAPAGPGLEAARERGRATALEQAVELALATEARA